MTQTSGASTLPRATSSRAHHVGARTRAPPPTPPPPTPASSLKNQTMQTPPSPRAPSPTLTTPTTTRPRRRPRGRQPARMIARSRARTASGEPWRGVQTATNAARAKDRARGKHPEVALSARVAARARSRAPQCATASCGGDDSRERRLANVFLFCRDRRDVGR